MLQSVSQEGGRAQLEHNYLNHACRRSSLALVRTFSDAVVLVEGDPAARDDISSYLRRLGMTVLAFALGEECLYAIRDSAVGCIILNTHLPDRCGLDVQRELMAISRSPVIFISDCFDLALVVRAMKAGAMDLFSNPMDLSGLGKSVKSACETSRRLWLHNESLRKLQTCYLSLTPREREVLPLVVGGLLNKQAAAFLGITEVTLQCHRSQVMRKLQAQSVAALVRMADALGVPPWKQVAEEMQEKSLLPASSQQSSSLAPGETSTAAPIMVKNHDADLQNPPVYRAAKSGLAHAP